MRPRLYALATSLPLALFSLACVATAAYAFAYLFMAYRSGDPFAAQFAVSGVDVPAHFFGAGLALLLVPLQLSRGVRRRWPALHRLGGWLSAVAILVGGVSGLSLAQHAQGDWPSRAGFSLLSLLWLGVTANGIRLAVVGQIARHRRWMAYSMALTAGAVTLRVMLALGTGVFGWPFMPVYVGTAWASWLFNLALCAWLLRLRAPDALSVAARGGSGRRWASGQPSA
ncbi:DUF2306 domain-containing protein [uncultured Luteimonas sp.]|uniref:DUF2306 domain-containing protein n=1 Tax=uncultured Luteimonas sp. TaxID=453144 RepID=UPI00260B5970|nr:DUF2306 domain-containing protein [uncultured Luteimonas sp.]